MTNRFFLSSVVVIILIFNGINSTSLQKYLRPGQTFCFSEDLPRHTLWKLSGSSESYPVRIQVMQLREIVVNETTKVQSFSVQKTSQKFGVYRFCLTNMYNQHQLIRFTFLHGARANDFGSHSQNSDYIKSLENQARIADMFADQIKEDNRQGLEILSQNIKYGGKFSVQYFFTVIFIGIIGFCTYMQYQIIRSHMAARKYI